MQTLPLILTIATSFLAAYQDPVAPPAGTVLRVRLDQKLDAELSRPGDRFSATLVDPVQLNGRAVAKGAIFHGTVKRAEAAGRLNGRAVVEISLDSYILDGTSVNIAVVPLARVSGRPARRSLSLVGGGAGAGAILGGVAGGGIGALIGVGAGAAAGATATVFTKGHAVFPAETLLNFQLSQ